MGYEAKIIEDSFDDEGTRLTTFVVTFPRFILAEVNTHRIASKSSASSRAIPISKIIQRVRDDPFIPEFWGKNQPGMQAEREIDLDLISAATSEWKFALVNALDSAEHLAETGVHKQLVNRLLEPFMWHTSILTATEWENFFALRNNKDAQPEMQKIASLMESVYRENFALGLVERKDAHLPYVTTEEREKYYTEEAMSLSAARCARVSYLNHDGSQPDVEKDFGLALRLARSGHWSPFEHQAFCSASLHTEYPPSNFTGRWIQYRKTFPFESDFSALRKYQKESNILK